MGVWLLLLGFEEGRGCRMGEMYYCCVRVYEYATTIMT